MFDRLEDIVKHYEELMFELKQSVRGRGSETIPEADEGTVGSDAAGGDI